MRNRRMDLTGMVFGNLTAILPILEKDKFNHVNWECLCKCGNKKIVSLNNLRCNKVKSCGCLIHEKGRPRKPETKKRTVVHVKHGHSRMYGLTTASYRTWASMITRCRNPKSIHYDLYGGRGIDLCKEWEDFRGFLKDMGERPNDTTLERIDNNKGYEKDNCKWATKKEQSFNKITTKYIVLFGDKIKLLDAFEKYGVVPYRLCYCRIFKEGWDAERALITPHLKKRTRLM